MALDFSKPTDLCTIMGRCGSDKSCFNTTHIYHNYTIFYHSILQSFRDKPLRIFELGLGTNNVNLKSNMGKDGIPGASLHGWADYFPNATIFGADIDRDILFETPRIKTYYCDQTNPSDIKALWSNADLVAPFDLIVEDGLHTYDANVCFFENSIQQLKEGGIYIIEDVTRRDIPKFVAKLPEWRLRYPSRTFDIVMLPLNTNYNDNNIIYIH